MNLASYTTAIEADARNTLGRAILEYLVNFQIIVPVWSGASHATLTELARLISAPLAIQPSETAYDGRGTGRRRGGAKLTATNGKYGFVFETDLPHLVYNEFNNANSNPDKTLRGKLLNPGPYNFQEQLGNSVSVVLRGFTLPDLNRYITTFRVR